MQTRQTSHHSRQVTDEGRYQYILMSFWFYDTKLNIYINFITSLIQLCNYVICKWGPEITLVGLLIEMTFTSFQFTRYDFPSRIIHNYYMILLLYTQRQNMHVNSLRMFRRENEREEDIHESPAVVMV